MNNNQHNALKSVWITANAGSGKTYNLTERVLALLVRGVLPERIYCITYTKAAASEMRERVLKGLRELLLAEDVELQETLEKLLGARPTEAQITHARGLFGAVLDSPAGGLQLTTIHGFCQNVLSRFPLEAGIAPHFTVLDEVGADRLLRQTIHHMLGQAERGDAELAAALTLISERVGESRFDELMGHIIGKRLIWVKLWRAQSVESLRNHLWAAHELDEGVTQDGLDEAFLNNPDKAMAHKIRALLPTLMSHKNKTEQAIGHAYAVWLEAPFDTRAEHMERVLCCWQNADGTLKKKAFSIKPGEAGFEALEYLRGVAERYVTARAALACAEESFAMAVLARALNELYAVAKQQIHALDYDDLIAHTRRLFAQPETLGWVMSKLDHRIDHLLIDEAQDTSGEQWDIARLLVDELMANNDGVGSGGQPRSLLVVGDEKQSIYSFNGAAPELLAIKQQEFTALLAHTQAPVKTRTLDTSYRSSASVLTLVDHVASQPEIAKALSAGGEQHLHEVHRTDAPGLVALYPTIVTPEKPKAEPFIIPTMSPVKDSAAAQMAKQVAELLHQWLHVEKRLLASEGRPMRAGDIIILVRNRVPMMLPLIRALERAGIAVAGLDRLNLAKHLAVRDLLALMRWCANNADDLALAQVLRSPLVGMSDEALRAIAYGRKGSLWAEVESPELSRWLELRHATPYEFLTEVLEVSGTRVAFARRFGSEVQEVLDELKAQSAAMPPELQLTITQFEQWIAGSTREIKREQEGRGANQLRIMTVHGAKGLEAPVVLMVDTSSVPNTGRESMFFIETAHGQTLPALALSGEAKQAALLIRAKEEKDRALKAEYQRLLYVALTRARDELHVFGVASKSGSMPAACWYETVATSMRSLGANEGADGLLTLRNSGTAKPEKHEEITAAGSLPAWAITLPAQVAQPPRVLSPSHLSEMPVVGRANALEGAKERGVRMHKVLELLRAESDAVEIARLVQHLAPDWTEAQRTSVVSEIAALHAQENWLWQHRALPEASICGEVEVRGSKIPVSGQMDLLVETPEAWVIVDYKTGRHVPRTPSDVPLNYLIQMKTYHALVAQLYPEKPVRTAILWTFAPSLMWLDDVVQTTDWPNQLVMNRVGVAA